MTQQSVIVCETTSYHDAHVAKMINLSSKGFNTLSDVFDKSSNTLTRKSFGHLVSNERINKAYDCLVSFNVYWDN